MLDRIGDQIQFSVTTEIRYVMLAAENQIARLEYVIREQMAEIDRLRAEVRQIRLAGGHGCVSATDGPDVEPRPR